MGRGHIHNPANLQPYSDPSRSNRGSLLVARDFRNVFEEHAKELGGPELQLTVQRLLMQLSEADCVMLSKAIKRTPN